MTKIQAQKKGKTYSNIYKEEWTQPWPMDSESFLDVHENPRAFFNSSIPVFDLKYPRVFYPRVLFRTLGPSLEP